MAHHDESLIDRVKNALGMGDDHDDAGGDVDRDDGRHDAWAGVPQALSDDTSQPQAMGGYGSDDSRTDEPSGLGRNPGPAGSARYEDAATPHGLAGTDDDAATGLDTTREDVAATEYGGAYGEDDTPMPTTAARDRGAAPPDEPEFGSDEDLDRRETGI